MMHFIKQLVGNLRGHAQLGVVSAVNDSGQAQTVNLATGDGVNRADVEVAWPFGFSSMPPADGRITVVIALGADPANLMALPVGNPSARFGGLAVGEAVIYSGDGSRVHVRNGSIEIWSTTIKMFGNVAVEGNITATGNITWGMGSPGQTDAAGHEHEYMAGGGPMAQTSPPIAGT